VKQECNGGKKYGQKGTLCGPNTGISSLLVARMPVEPLPASEIYLS
jgi:hypothetical protein